MSERKRLPLTAGAPSPKAEVIYATEASLVQKLTLIVQDATSAIQCLAITAEFNFRSGRTDLVGIDADADLHAFEAKLTKWKKALEQARRNSSYAHYAYVVLPSKAAAPALKARQEFERRGVGLVVVDHAGHTVEIAPRRSEPLLPWLTESAKKQLAAM